MDALGVIIGAIVGGIITSLVAWMFYKKATNDLIEITAELKLVSQLIIFKLQYPDTPTEIKMDDEGNVVGLKFTKSANVKSESKVSGKLTKGG